MLIDRIGGILVSPREGVRQIVAGQGVADVTLLLATRVAAGETPRIARALVRGWEGNPSAAVSGVLAAATAVLPDVLGILIGAILLSLLGGRKKPIAERGKVSDRTLDVAAYAWIPYLAVSLAGALLFTAIGRPMKPIEEYLINGVALGWATLVWIIGLSELRKS
jgi:hypothetical protein